VSAGRSADAAELAQLQQIAPVMPPPCNFCSASAVVALSGKFQVTIDKRKFNRQDAKRREHAKDF
jgi:hypothetical protein